jgi:hypothetical protein
MAMFELSDQAILDVLKEESPEDAQEILRLAAEMEGEEWEEEAVARAREEQALMAGFNGGEASLRDGEVKMRVHPLFWHYWGQRLGYECWDDNGFVREFLRDNESARVKNVRPRLTVQVPDVPRAVRYTKSFGVI